MIDCYSLKPIDSAAIVEALRVTAGRLVVVEDHWAEGGIGEAVLTALATAGLLTSTLRYRYLAVRGMPGSGKPAELLAAAGISAAHIAEAARQLLREG